MVCCRGQLRESKISIERREASSGRALTISHYSLGHQHVVQSHELGIWGILVLNIAEAQHCPLLDLAQDREEGRLHAMAVERVFAGLERTSTEG